MLAMYSPSGEYRAVDSETLEQELRSAGWLNGHEYFSKQQEPVRSEHTASENVFKVGDVIHCPAIPEIDNKVIVKDVTAKKSRKKA